MKYRQLPLALVVLFTLTFMVPPGRPEPPLQALQDHAANVTTMNERFQQVFGPAPALAACPYLGLAVLTGTALLIEQPVIANSDSALVRRLRGNVILRQARGYASWWLFAILAILALVTAALNSGKLQGTLGKAAHLVEAGLVAAAYLALMVPALSSQVTASTLVPPHAAQDIALASLVPALDSGRITLIITAGIALVPLMFVRFAFDVLIWISPLPVVDLLFQIAKTIFSLFFLALYLINPLAAAVLALFFYIPALFLLPWAARLLNFAFRIIVKPLLARLSPTFKANLQDRTAKVMLRPGMAVLTCSANVLKARGFKKRHAVAIIQTSEHTLIQPLRRPNAARALAGAGEQLVIGKALAWIELRVITAEGRPLDQIALPYSLASDYQTLCRALGARDLGHIGVRQLLRTAAEKAKHGVSAAAHAAQDQLDKHFVNPRKA